MKDGMRIRISEEKDAQTIADFNKAMAFETEGKTLSDEVVLKGVDAVFTDESKGFYVVAEDSERKVVGGLLITFEWSDWRNAWFWWIQSVYIVPEARGKRVYSELYEFVKKLAAQKGDVCGFRLYVEKENTHAQKVYEKLGMIENDYISYEELIPEFFN